MGNQTRKSVGLSKSRVMAGIQCPKRLYLQTYQPELATPTDSSQQAIYDQGTLIGILARDRFSGGLLISADHNHPEDALADTRDAIAANAAALFEAAFTASKVLVRVDVLSRAGKDLWDLIEVKSSTSVDENYIDDVTVQAWVLQKSGIKLNKCYVMHINNQCVFPNLADLFTKADVTDLVNQRLPSIAGIVTNLLRVLKQKDFGEIDIGPHCDSPYACPFKDNCWREKHIPEISAFEIPRLASRIKWQLYEKGLIHLDKIDSASINLNAIQRKMIEVSLSGTRHVNTKEIKKALRSWTFPLFYLDFETISPAVPRYPNTHPYQQVPFQFSCHKQNKPESPLTHSEYLHDSTSDPREQLINALLGVIGGKGSVVAYNKGFESARLTELSVAFPQYSKELMNIAQRLVDPLPIFRSNVYDREFHGSFSIKQVAPALLGTSLSYEGMTVSGGGEAQAAFEEMISPQTNAKRRNDLRRALLEYCKMDTFAMVQLVEWLRQSANI